MLLLCYSCETTLKPECDSDQHLDLLSVLNVYAHDSQITTHFLAYYNW